MLSVKIHVLSNAFSGYAARHIEAHMYKLMIIDERPKLHWPQRHFAPPLACQCVFCHSLWSPGQPMGRPVQSTGAWSHEGNRRSYPLPRVCGQGPGSGDWTNYPLSPCPCRLEPVFQKFLILSIHRTQFSPREKGLGVLGVRTCTCMFNCSFWSVPRNKRS